MSLMTILYVLPLALGGSGFVNFKHTAIAITRVTQLIGFHTTLVRLVWIVNIEINFSSEGNHSLINANIFAWRPNT